METTIKNPNCGGMGRNAFPCGKCAQCVADAKDVLSTLKTKSLCDLTADQQDGVTAAARIIIDHYGHKGYMQFMKTGSLTV